MITVLEESSSSSNRSNNNNDEEATDQFTAQEIVVWCRGNVGSEVEQRPAADFLQQGERSSGIPASIVVPVPDVIVGWSERLHDGDTCNLIRSYNGTIRNTFMRKDELILLDISVLQHYELLLSQHLRDRTTSPAAASLMAASLRQISKDIFSLTRSQNDGYGCAVRTILIPTLMRIITTVLIATRGMDLPALARVAALLLSFDQAQLSSSILMPALDHCDLMENCAIPMDTPQCVIGQENQVAELDAKRWKDECTVQSASSCWRALATHLQLSLSAHEVPSKQVCRELQWETVAQAVRAQFFEKDNDKGTVAKPPITRNLTYLLSLSPSIAAVPAFQKEHARIHAGIFLIKAIGSPTRQILSDMLPVCYALIDSSNPKFVTLGCAALVALLNTQQDQEVDWKEFEDTLFSVLEIAAKTTADPVAIRYVGIACSKACELLPHRRKERRQITHQFLRLVQINMRNRSDINGLLCGIIIGGLIPLLHQAKQNAEATEVGRLGLEVFLPLLRWDFGLSGRKVQVATLVVLINLMVAAYPIMPHHGGNIASELMACWGQTKRRLQDSDRLLLIEKEEQRLCAIVLALSTHACAIALVFCGERTRAIVTKIQTSNFDSDMVEHATDVENCYQRLRERKG